MNTGSTDEPRIRGECEDLSARLGTCELRSTWRVSKEETPSPPTLPAPPLAPGKAVVSRKAFVQNWEECPKAAEREALHGWRTCESAAGVLKGEQGERQGPSVATWNPTQRQLGTHER